jgi:hypothetical protein
MEIVRNSARQGVVNVFSRSWAGLCSGPGRKRMLDALGYYYGHRARQMSTYAKRWGEAGGSYIAEAWTTARDAQVERLTREMYGRGYFKPDDVARGARGLLTETVRGERVTGRPCIG